jgi:hypothetical protein
MLGLGCGSGANMDRVNQRDARDKLVRRLRRGRFGDPLSVAKGPHTEIPGDRRAPLGFWGMSDVEVVVLLAGREEPSGLRT